MSSVNKVILVGNLGADPEVRTFQNGGKVCNLRIATSETWKDKNTGERRERTEWHSVAIFSEPLVRVAEQYLRKGSKVYIEGQLETRKWQDQSGSDRYSTEVALRPFTGQITMLDSRSENVFHNDPETPSLPTEDATPKKPSIDFDDEIPF
jgi:single-strand DNA-binding protein